MGLNWVGTGNLNLDDCIHYMLCFLLLLLGCFWNCVEKTVFYVTKRKSGREELYQLSCVLLAASSGHRICYVAKVL